MQHRYVVWEGHYRGRYFREMHIIDHADKPICSAWTYPSIEHVTIYKGRPEVCRLCRSCTKHREAFEQAEQLRTWQELAKAEP